LVPQLEPTKATNDPPTSFLLTTTPSMLTPASPSPTAGSTFGLLSLL
jgi:hypothetical protein